MAILFGFLGGLLLNLMPCVFPVLSIKVLSFTELAGRDPREARLHTLTFSAGVVVSFWVLAGILALLRAGGMQLGWGFQLQSPLFVVALIGVFMGVALLFLSPLTIGASVQRMAGRLRLPASLLGSFLDGVLATAVATPCTAPLMGTAVAAAVTLSTSSSFAIFTSMGLGMSAPYLMLAWRTGLLRHLPRPGAWMERLKQLLAFPLFATAVWLLRVFGRQIGIAPAHLTLLLNVVWGMLLLALGVWVLHQAAVVKTRWRSRLHRLIGCGVLVSAAIVAAPPPQEIERAQRITTAAADSPGHANTQAETDSYGLAWLPFSEERLRAVQTAQKPVYIDFTAEWCITCQVNKRTVFSSERVRALVASREITLLRADWTSANPEITMALKKFGRAGVPLNVLYTGMPHEQPILFPALLSAGIVAEAFEQLPVRGSPHT
jgi:thiol:disulfide interchange protein DsbD